MDSQPPRTSSPIPDISIEMDPDLADREMARRRQSDEELRAVATHARCMLWHGEVTGLPGWESGAFDYHRQLFRWSIHVQDENAAQQILPLVVAPGETYADAWFRSRLKEDDEKMWRNAAAVLSAGHSHLTQEYRCIDRFGNLRWQSEDLNIQKISHGRWRAFSVVVDRTESKRVEEELRKAKETAEAASLAKDRFLAILSHELRTPLTPVLATVNLVEARADLPVDLRTDIATIRKNVEMEARLIDDLLDLTRVNRGKVELRNEVLNAHAAIQSAWQTCESEAQEKQLTLTLNLKAESSHVFADPARLQQIFWNLLKNAIKFTQAHGSIIVNTSNPADAGGSLRIEVQDSGIGIESDLLPRLFDEFEQGERTITRRYGGLGLGLSISKALVQMLGGTLAASSPGLGQGATFTVILPTMKKPAVSASPPARPTSEPANSAVILLVDDHHDTLAIMSRLLRSTGYQVLAADSIAAAVALAMDHKIDLLVSDIGLPDGSGTDLMQQLRSRHGMKGIALSGFGMDDDIRKSGDAGFTRHLTKPVNFRQLAETIRDVLRAGV